ncbi:MAG: nucleotidyltransferase domain-containing protein [Acidimicrobiales bacterium]
MTECQRAQLWVIRSVITALGTNGIRAWLFGGWGLDTQIGRITREHDDIEFWIERRAADDSQMALVRAGSTVLMTQPPEEPWEFEWNGVTFSTAYFDRHADGRLTIEGRWSDWAFPTDSSGDDTGNLEGVSVPTMSIAGMLAMKEQYPDLRNGRPWRPKDLLDIEALRSLLGSR